MSGRRGVMLLFVLLSLSCRGPRDPADEAGKAAGIGRPRLRLSSTASSGFSPMTTLLVARLEGVALDDAIFADPAERWLERKGELESVVEREPGEGRVKPEGRPRLFYERSVTLTDPGAYRFQLTLRGANGEAVASNWVTVRVILKE